MTTTIQTPPGAPPAGPGPAAARPGPGRLRRAWRKFDPRVSPYLFIAPFFLVFLVFGLFPLVYTFVVSLNDWDLTATSHEFIGLANYRELVADAYFWNALRNTLTIFLLASVPQLLAALGLAQLLHTRLRLRTLFRMGVLLPNITSVAAVTLIFAQLFGRDFGLVNWLLGLVGIGPVDWQSGRLSSNVAIATMVDWRWTGYNALIYLAAMQAIPRDLYEAAALDGAGAFRQFRSITIPMLRPTIIFTTIVTTIGGIQLIAEPLLFDPIPNASGGADRQFQTIALYLYEQAFRRFDLGYGSAIAWSLFVITLLVTAVNVFFVRRLRSVR
jgi:cellobiose transport system permease protein